MKYAEVRETLITALDEVRALANDRHASREGGDVNEHLDLLLRIQYVTEAAVNKVSAS